MIRPRSCTGIICGRVEAVPGSPRPSRGIASCSSDCAGAGSQHADTTSSLFPFPGSRVGLLDLVKIEVDLIVARVNILVQNGSRRFPLLSRIDQANAGHPDACPCGGDRMVRSGLRRHRPALRPLVQTRFRSPSESAPIHESESAAC